MGCSQKIQLCFRLLFWLWCSLIMMLGRSSSASAPQKHAAPMVVPCVNAIVPYPEDPPFWIRAADLLHQGLFSKITSQSTGAGFSLDIEATITTVSTADCAAQSNSTAKNTKKLSLYQFKPSPKKLLLRDLVSVSVPVTCDDSIYTFPSAHYGIAALGPSPTALPHQISSSASLALTFAYCIPTISQTGYGSLFFGVRSPISSYPYNIPSLTKAPMSVSSRYSIGLTSVEMSNGLVQKLGNGGLPVILSTQATFISLPNTTYKYVYSGITKALSRRGISEYKFDSPTYPTSGCYSLKKADIQALPKMKLVFSVKYPLILDATNYFTLIRDSIYCISIYEKDEAFLGLNAQQDRLVEFDLEKKTFGFSEPLSKFNTSCALKFPSSSS